MNGETLLDIVNIKIENNYRKNGISDYLFQVLLKEFPRTMRIRTTLTATNWLVYTQAKASGLSDLEALRKTPAYKIRMNNGWGKVNDFWPELDSFIVEKE